MAVTKAQVAQLYVALFNRAPEGAGLNAWFAAGATKTQAQLADDMLRSPAVQSYFNGRIDTDRGFVSNIYKNFLGKDYADDPAGIESWVRHLEAGHSRGETLVKLFEVAQTPEAIAAAPVAAAIFRNKTAVSAYMAEKIADIAQRDDGTYDYEPFQAIIRGTTDTNLEEQKAKVDQLASGQTPSTNKNLTAETDNIVGTDGDDTFNGVYYVGNGTRTSTLSSLDTLDGKAGKDTLNLTVQKNGGDSDSVEMSAIEAAMRGVSNIENLNIRSEVKFSTSTTPPPPATIPFTVNKGLDNLSIQTIGGVNISSTDTKEKISIDTTGTVTLNAADVTKEVTVKSSSAAVTVTADKLEDKVSIEAGAGATLTAEKVKEVIIKAKGDANITADKATKVNINLNDQANTLTIATSHPLAEATEVTLSSLKLAADLAVAKAAKISTKDVKFDGKAISTDIENVDFSMEYTGNNVGDAKLTASAADKVKTLSINAKAQKSATLTIDSTNINSLTKVTVKGDAKDLTLDLSAQTALKDIDASAFTGNFAELYVKNTENSTFKLGSGDDVVKLNLSTTPTDQKKQTIDGGAGTDLLMIDAAIAAGGKSDDVTINNFEGLKISGQVASTIDMAKWTGFSHITLVGDSSASVTSANATFNNLLNNSTITLEGKNAGHDITLNIKDAATGTNDTVNIVLDPKTFTVSGSDKIGLNNAGNFVIDDIENVNITSNLDAEKTEGVKNTVKFNATADAKGVLTNATIKGDADTEVIFGSNIKKIKALDASALTGKFKFDGTAHVTENATIKGSATKDNTITLNATAKGSTVETGAGKDTITLASTEKYTVNAGENDDTITGIGSTSGTVVTGGAGKDTFVINKGIDPVTFAASKTSTITDFTKGDIIKIGGSTAAVTQDKIVKYEVSGSLDFANNFKEALKAAGDQKVAYFTYRDPDSNSTDTYVVKSNGADAVADPNDYVVKLSGAVDLSNATITTSGNDTLITL
jgi:putative surface array protein